MSLIDVPHELEIQHGGGVPKQHSDPTGLRALLAWANDRDALLLVRNSDGVGGTHPIQPHHEPMPLKVTYTAGDVELQAAPEVSAAFPWHEVRYWQAWEAEDGVGITIETLWRRITLRVLTSEGDELPLSVAAVEPVEQPVAAAPKRSRARRASPAAVA